jgi:hypothetical protein
MDNGHEGAQCAYGAILRQHTAPFVFFIVADHLVGSFNHFFQVNELISWID